MTASASLARQIRACEMDVSVSQATEAMRLLAKQALARQQQMTTTAPADYGREAVTTEVDGNVDSTSGSGPSGVGGDEAESSASFVSQDPQDGVQMSLMGKLQRLEMERRLQDEEISDLREQLQLAKTLTDQVGSLELGR